MFRYHDFSNAFAPEYFAASWEEKASPNRSKLKITVLDRELVHVLERLRDQLLNHCVVVADEVRFVIVVEGLLYLTKLMVRQSQC